jgi:hypothetical protein
MDSHYQSRDNGVFVRFRAPLVSGNKWVHKKNEAIYTLRMVWQLDKAPCIKLSVVI